MNSYQLTHYIEIQRKLEVLFKNDIHYCIIKNGRHIQSRKDYYMELKPITKEQYEKYIDQSIQSYADELATSGLVDKENALAAAKNSFSKLLPDGENTKNNYLCYAYDNDKIVGFIWYGFRNESEAFIFDFFIEEPMRRKGYGKQVMLACEAAAKEKGAKTIGLHVFGHNQAARALYESLNYVPTSIQMKKEL